MACPVRNLVWEPFTTEAEQTTQARTTHQSPKPTQVCTGVPVLENLNLDIWVQRLLEAIGALSMAVTSCDVVNTGRHDSLQLGYTSVYISQLMQGTTSCLLNGYIERHALSLWLHTV